MFGLETLDVAIGMALLYLLVSLMCTAAVEMLEARLKTRSEDLEKGLRDLLNDPEGSGIVAEVYKHPLVFGLSGEAYKPSELGRSWLSKLNRLFPGTAKPPLPSYIPAKLFASAILDWASQAAAGAPADATVLQRVQHWASVGSGQDTVAGEDSLKGAVRSAVNRAQGSLGQVEANLKDWFDGGMDRVSGWYKRRTQVVLFFMGLGIAVAFNIDSLTIVNRLQNDDQLRAAAVEFAANSAPDLNPSLAADMDTAPSNNKRLDGEAADAEAADGPALGVEISGAGTSGAAVADAAASDAAASEVAGSDGAASGAVAAASQQPTAAAESNTPAGAPALDANASSEDNADLPPADARFERSRANLAAIGYPIGWRWGSIDCHGVRVPTVTPVPQAAAKGGGLMNLADWLSMFAGWLMTALAVTLGAPFWFDVLNKFMVIRSTVKPAEKSGEEGSEDRQPRKSQSLDITVTGGTPPK